MRLEHTLQIRRALQKFPESIQETFYKQVEFLKNDIRHPSLRAKKYDEATDVWQARVTGDVRFYFRIEGDSYRLLNIRKHPK